MICVTERSWPEVEASLRLVMPARTRRDEADEPLTQWAAVRTQVEEITEPPQKWLPLLDCRETCQGCCATVVLAPPTISRWVARWGSGSSPTAQPVMSPTATTVLIQRMFMLALLVNPTRTAKSAGVFRRGTLAQSQRG